MKKTISKTDFILSQYGSVYAGRAIYANGSMGMIGCSIEEELGQEYDSIVGEKHIPLSEIIRVLKEECDHIDDAVMYFETRMK